jgi:hypothetical protein
MEFSIYLGRAININLGIGFCFWPTVVWISGETTFGQTRQLNVIKIIRK